MHCARAALRSRLAINQIQIGRIFPCPVNPFRQRNDRPFTGWVQSAFAAASRVHPTSQGTRSSDSSDRLGLAWFKKRRRPLQWTRIGIAARMVRRGHGSYASCGRQCLEPRSPGLNCGERKWPDRRLLSAPILIAVVERAKIRVWSRVIVTVAPAKRDPRTLLNSELDRRTIRTERFRALAGVLIVRIGKLLRWIAEIVITAVATGRNGFLTERPRTGSGRREYARGKDANRERKLHQSKRHDPHLPSKQPYCRLHGRYNSSPLACEAAALVGT
jgi:hypothetical protein